MKPLQKIIFTAIVLTLTTGLSSFLMNNSSALPEIIVIEGGKVSGQISGSGDVISFKGIPFAAPPVGNLRWKAPQPVVPWNGVLKCETFSASPVQSKPVPFGVYTPEFLIPETPISEDCLYLNVWSNAKNTGDKKPVLVWIYGGGFNSGGSAAAIYDGEALAKQGIIFVSINYRVGALGFFAHPDLSKESPNKVSGNYGLLDQIAALKWVQKNIGAFGGDPSNVTIAGQSAGSMSVNSLVASPIAKGLFNKAIAESGSYLIPRGPAGSNTLKALETQGLTLANKLGKNSLADLRSLSSQEVQKDLVGRFGVNVDGYVLPAQIPEIFAAHQQNKVALLTGWNADESGTINKNAEQFKRFAEDEFGNDAALFLKLFPADNEEQAKQSQVAYGRAMSFALSGYKWANIQAEESDLGVYVYNFNRKVPAVGEFLKYGAFHTAEVPYALNNLKSLKNRPLTKEDHELAKLMSGYWVNFVKTGNPNGQGLPEWPKYTARQNIVKVFDAEPGNAQVSGKNGMDFLLKTVAY